MSPHWPSQVMVYQKSPTEHKAVDASQTHCLSRHYPMMAGGQTLTEQIQEGSFYEIDRTRLPTRTPSLLLRSIRVVMVTVKTDQHLTVRYPSTKSLESYLMDPSENVYPEMDEKFIMGSQLAAEVLVREIPSREFTRNSSLADFWVAQTSKTETPPLPLAVCKPINDAKSKLGTCLSKLQSSNIKSWGERRLVSYVKNVETNSCDVVQSLNQCSQAAVVKLEMQEEVEASVDIAECEESRHRSSGNDGQHVSSVDHVDVADIKGVDRVDVADIKKEMEEEVATTTLRPRKRKCRSYASSKKIRTSDLDEKNVISCHLIKKEDRDIFRWSATRYENAKSELLAVMKARQATCQNPITRHALRTEARKRVGDTGLLDHLLKHVVDTLAPGGTDRFKRRWDSQGVMEYFLESADLNDIRKKAGVEDPYWTPPPGWKPGDPICNHNYNCGAVISSLKEELAQMRGEMQVLEAQKHEHTLENLFVSRNIGRIETLDPALFKRKYDDLLKEKARREQELLEISKSLKKMEILMRKQSEGLDG